MNLSDQFIILALKPNKTGYRIGPQQLIAGITGALFLELTFDKQISIKDKYVSVAKTGRSKDSAHQLILEKIQSRQKPRKIKNWISFFAQRPGRIKKIKLNQLARNHKIRIIPKRFLFIKYKEVALVDTTYQRKLINELLAALKSKMNLTEENISLLALVHACKMHKVLSDKKEDIKRYKTELKEFINSNEVAKNVDTVIREMQSAVVAAVVSTAVVTSAGGN